MSSQPRERCCVLPLDAAGREWRFCVGGSGRIDYLKVNCVIAAEKC